MARSKLPFKQTDISRAVRGVIKAGVGVDRVLVDNAGNIAVITKPAELDSSNSNDIDEILNGIDKTQTR
jgi:hypothetical protein